MNENVEVVETNEAKSEECVYGFAPLDSHVLRRMAMNCVCSVSNTEYVKLYGEQEAPRRTEYHQKAVRLPISLDGRRFDTIKELFNYLAATGQCIVKK